MGNSIRPGTGDVTAFLARPEFAGYADDCSWLVSQRQEITGCPPVMWGDSIVGFDSYHYRYASGREGDWFVPGLSPRKTSLSIHVQPHLAPCESLLDRLGRVKTGKSCLYVKRLDDIDRKMPIRLLKLAHADMKKCYPGDQDSC